MYSDAERQSAHATCAAVEMPCDTGTIRCRGERQVVAAGEPVEVLPVRDPRAAQQRGQLATDVAADVDRRRGPRLVARWHSVDTWL